MTNENVILVMNSNDSNNDEIPLNVKNGYLYCKACGHFYGFTTQVTLEDHQRVSSVFMKLHKKCKAAVKPLNYEKLI